MIDKIGAEARAVHFLGERHAYRRRDALPERACRCFDTRAMAIFGMASGGRSELTEGFERPQFPAGIAG